MLLLVNDLSLHGQFTNLDAFGEAIGRVMSIRQMARRNGHELRCHSRMRDAEVTPTLSMPAAISALVEAKRRALMQWLTQQGPFWDDTRQHGPGDYLAYNDDIVVTDTALGEAAYCCLTGTESHVVSVIPSSWKFTPVTVQWSPDSGPPKTVEVRNHWEPGTLEEALQAAPIPMASWQQLESAARSRCPHLTFGSDAFQCLLGHPFVPGAAQALLIRLTTLNRLKDCFDEHGQRTPEGHSLYQDHFTGDKAWFSDSSDAEKRDFETELTFRLPTPEGESLLCGWHGKVKTPQLRIHFSWPISATRPVYVVYVGPKITRR